MENLDHLSDEQKQSYIEQLDRGRSYLEMTKTDGWKYFLDGIQTAISMFATKSLSDGFETIADFQYERGKVQGLRTHLARIESDIQIYKSQQENESKQDGQSTE